MRKGRQATGKKISYYQVLWVKAVFNLVYSCEGRAGLKLVPGLWAYGSDLAGSTNIKGAACFERRRKGLILVSC